WWSGLTPGSSSPVSHAKTAPSGPKHGGCGSSEHREVCVPAGGLLLVVGARLADVLDLAHGFAEVGQPGLAVPRDPLDAPAEGVAAGAGHAGVDEGVEHLALGLAETGHHGRGQRREDRPGVAAADAPGDLAAGGVFEFAGDLDPALPGVLP